MLCQSGDQQDALEVGMEDDGTDVAVCGMRSKQGERRVSYERNLESKGLDLGE